MIPVHHADKFIGILAILKKRHFFKILNSMGEEDRWVFEQEQKVQRLDSKTNSMTLGLDLQELQQEELFKKALELMGQTGLIFDDKKAEKQKQEENREKAEKLEQDNSSKLLYRLRQEKELAFGPENDVMRVSASNPVRRHHLSAVQLPRLLQHAGGRRLQRGEHRAHQMARLPLRRRAVELQAVLHPQANDC